MGHYYSETISKDEIEEEARLRNERHERNNALKAALAEILRGYTTEPVDHADWVVEALNRAMR